LRALRNGKKKVGKMDENKVTLEISVRTTTYFSENYNIFQ
jgi:hypothetical protein